MSDRPDPPRLLPAPAECPPDAILFLDFDGTLVDIADAPDAIVVDTALVDLLASLATRFTARLAVVSGRSIAQLDGLIGPVAGRFALSGSHGAEFRFQGDSEQRARPAALDQVEQAMLAAAAAHPGVLVEAKSQGVALHFRGNPDFAATAEALARRLGRDFGLSVQPGKMVFDLHPHGTDKGQAVGRFLAHGGTTAGRPVFIGDDATDEHGFIAAKAAGGFGILVGTQRETAADYRLPDPAAVRHWLGEAIR